MLLNKRVEFVHWLGNSDYIHDYWLKLWAIFTNLSKICTWAMDVAPQRGGGHIFEIYGISLDIMPTSHAVSLSLFMYSGSAWFCNASFVKHLLMQ